MHRRYRLGVHETRRQMRDTLIRIALAHEGTLIERSGVINESALAKALGVSPSTARRLIRPEVERQRELEYTPKGPMLRGVARLTGCKTEGAALDHCHNPVPVSDADLKLYIRPDGAPKRPKKYQKAT